MLYVLLLCCMSCMHGAASNIAFYSDARERPVRMEMLERLKRGPIRELDAYLSYVSDMMYLSNCETANMTFEGLEEYFIRKVLRDKFDVSRWPQDALETITTKVGLQRIESGIELGLEQLAKQKLVQSEINEYYTLNSMIHRLADSLHENKQALFWKQYMKTLETVEEKKATFTFYIALKKRAQAAHVRLNSYYHLLDQALKAQFNDNIVQS